MPSDQTRNAILAAAERLYADRGFGDVTLRDIVAELEKLVVDLVRECFAGKIVNLMKNVGGHGRNLHVL